MILHHHEKYEGGGYPLSIKSDEIPLESRIIAVADTYDAMTSDRPYRKSLSHKEALHEIIRFEVVQFDGKVVHGFNKI